VRVRVPLAEVTTAGISFRPESRARSVTVAFVVPGALDVVVGAIELVLVVEEGEGLTGVEVERADPAEVEVEMAGSLPSEKMNTPRQPRLQPRQRRE